MGSKDKKSAKGKKGIVDFIVDAAMDEDLVKIFRQAGDGEELRNNIRATYSVSVEDCTKLIEARNNIVPTLKDKKGCY